MPNVDGKPKYLTLDETKALWKAQGVLAQTYKGKCTTHSLCEYVWNKSSFTYEGQEVHGWGVTYHSYHLTSESASFIAIPSGDGNIITSGTGRVISENYDNPQIKVVHTKKEYNPNNYDTPIQSMEELTYTRMYIKTSSDGKKYGIYSAPVGVPLQSNGLNIKIYAENLLSASKKYNDKFTSYLIEQYNATNQEREYNFSDTPIITLTNDGVEKGAKIVTNPNESWDITPQPITISPATDWMLYIDGKSNPLYKLTWKCDGLKDIDTSYTNISIWVGTYNVFDDTFNDEDGTKFKEVDYDKHSIKFSYSDLEKLVSQPIAGHNPPSIRVQLGYREFQTARFTTSTSMGCELYFDSHPQNTLYTELGYLTMENGTWHRTQSGDGSTFTVKDGKAGSDGYTDDNDHGYDDGKDNDEKDNDTGDVSAGIGVLTSTFKMTKERLVQLGQFLWGSNIFDKFSLVNNNPIENIISCKSIPINTDGTNQEIILGNVSTGVNGEKISNNFAKQTIGSIAINEHYHNFLDYAPYTNVILYLPYIGFKELDTTLVMNKTLQVIYTVDAITGGCLAQVYVNSVRLYEFTGNVGIDITITASNRAQVEAGYIQAGVGATASALGGNVGSAVTSLLNSATSQYHYSSTGNPSPMCVASTNRTCYVIIDRPNYQNLKAFNHTRGRKCYLSKTIGKLHGFTICDSNIDLSGINATQSELEELKEILSSGFYV